MSRLHCRHSSQVTQVSRSWIRHLGSNPLVPVAKHPLSSSVQNGSVSAPFAPLLNSSSFVVLSYPPPLSVSFPSSSSPHSLPLLHLLLPIVPLRTVPSLPPPPSFTLIPAPRHLPTLLLSTRILSLPHHPPFSLPLLLTLLHHATSHVPLLPPPPRQHTLPPLRSYM